MRSMFFLFLILALLCLPVLAGACERCSGSGKCWTCSGTGRDCSMCNATGRCYFCSGKGNL